MTKKLTFSCDMCLKEINGEMSVYIFNDTRVLPDLSLQPVQKESHFCKDCTEDVKKVIETLYAKDNSAK